MSVVSQCSHVFHGFFCFLATVDVSILGSLFCFCFCVCVFVFQDRTFLCSPGSPGTHSGPCWPWSQRSVCLYLPSAMIKSVHHHHPKETLFKPWSLLGLKICSISKTYPPWSKLIEVREDWVSSALVCMILWSPARRYWFSVLFMVFLTNVLPWFPTSLAEASLHHCLVASYSSVSDCFMYLKTFVKCIHVDHRAFWQMDHLIICLYFFSCMLIDLAFPLTYHNYDQPSSQHILIKKLPSLLAFCILIFEVRIIFIDFTLFWVFWSCILFSCLVWGIISTYISRSHWRKK